MVHITAYVLLLLSVLKLCRSYTIEYDNSQKYCKGNQYSHIYDYLTENTYCFKLQWCDEDHCCVHECGAYYWRAKQVNILETELIPPNAFADSEHLLHITGIQQKIVSLASKSFVNLENLEGIYLSFNNIRYVQRDIFINVSATVLDMSWNKLIYIDQDAFDGLPNLKILNVSHNELTYIYAFPKDSVLTELIISYNNLQRLVVSGVRYPKLEVLDASVNNLTNIAITSKNNMKLIDLTKNDLEKLDVFGVLKVEDLRIGKNNFKYIAVTICEHVNKIDVSFNPLENSIRTELLSKCSHTDPVNEENTQQYCVDDEMCPSDQICRTHRCLNPCNGNVCDSTSVCKTKDHVFTCECPGSFKRNPVEFQSPCYDVQCFEDEDCPENIPCNASHICDSTKTVSIFGMSSTVQTYPWYYDKEDPVLGVIVYTENYHKSEGKHYENKTEN